jgi:hypothetical protein
MHPRFCITTVQTPTAAARECRALVEPAFERHVIPAAGELTSYRLTTKKQPANAEISELRSQQFSGNSEKPLLSRISGKFQAFSVFSGLPRKSLDLELAPPAGVEGFGKSPLFPASALRV